MTAEQTEIVFSEIITPSQLLSYHFDNIEHQRRLTDANIIAICEIFGGMDDVLSILLSAHAHDLDSEKLRQLKIILQSTDPSTPDIDIASVVHQTQ